MKPIIKWPGGKSREIHKIKDLIPSYDRYIEPFFGGGALFFHLSPKTAVINDISAALIQYYTLIKQQDQQLYKLLMCYHNSFSDIIAICEKSSSQLLNIFSMLKEKKLSKEELNQTLNELITSLIYEINPDFTKELLLDKNEFAKHLQQMTADKFMRTVKNHEKKPYSTEDLCENLITGFTSGYYMYFRKVFNDIHLGYITNPSIQYQAANFYFIREYCYGSMFRYNQKGEFNIPYGGMTYNHKNMKSKIDRMFNKEINQLFSHTDIHCCDFEEFFAKVPLSESDFMFLDPPYDTDFSNYEGTPFEKSDHERLARVLKKTPARFILIIKNTDFIYHLYEEDFTILCFDTKYTYNVRSRNNRNTEHLIITNLPV
ncbi:MAG: DNA adenine methylase [Peptococcaceae bacterium]|nr:DNA adenine methylase [Peptococcaceae bacterium]